MNVNKIGDILVELLDMDGYKSNNYYRNDLKYSTHYQVKYLAYIDDSYETLELFKETKVFSVSHSNRLPININIKVVNKHLFIELDNTLYLVNENAEIIKEKKLK
ncbi:hypothetical protein Koombakaat1_00065 [Staphylococcus phage Koomba-kaat_1]|nr:hypothetical protein [Staphylococcus phage vB_SauM-V1SA20]UXE02855.1 hypothetical protein Koombakaat1_00065 [Staphylococcus phage Koomba-kaat_1]